MNELERAESALPAVNRLRALLLALINEFGVQPRHIYATPGFHHEFQAQYFPIGTSLTEFMGCEYHVTDLLPEGCCIVTQGPI